MALSQFIKTPCTLKRATGNSTADRYGNEATAYVDVSTVCELQPIRRGESNEGEISDTGWRAYFMPDEDMGTKPTANRLVVAGQTYEFVGAPAKRASLAGDDHIAADLRITE